MSRSIRRGMPMPRCSCCKVACTTRRHGSGCCRCSCAGPTADIDCALLLLLLAGGGAFQELPALFALGGAGVADAAELGILAPVRPLVGIRQVVADGVEQLQVARHARERPAGLPFVGGLVI